MDKVMVQKIGEKWVVKEGTVIWSHHTTESEANREAASLRADNKVTDTVQEKVDDLIAELAEELGIPQEKAKQAIVDYLTF